ncbi:MAG TPA: LpqB family beta-propeller domain-containing protein [Candidatus Nanopelagicales bacterium]
MSRAATRSRARLPLVRALVLAGLLSACAVVPTSGPIEQGPVVDSGESTQFIRVIAAPPSSGAAPEEIVRGFLEASASLEQDHAIARRYLQPRAAQAWDATAGTTIYDPASLEVRARGPRVRVTLAVIGRLQPDGTLVNVVPAEELTLQFTLTQEPQESSRLPEWRITDPPDGVLISSTDLRRAYRPHQVYFLSRRAEVLVPDGRMLPVVGPSLPTALTELVLQGPSGWLEPAVRTGIPAGTALALGAVPVTDGVAEVELSQEALSATDAQRRDLASQLTWTLTQLPGVSAVRLVVAGEPYVVPGAPTLLDRGTWLAQAPDALSLGTAGTLRPPSFVLDGDQVVRSTAVGRTTVAVEVPDAEQLLGLAVSLDQRRAATIAADRRSLWVLPLEPVAGTPPLQVPGGRITDVAFDVDERAWFVDAGRLRRVGGEGEPQDVPVAAPGLSGITALAMARDGARVAVAADGRVYVAALQEQAGTVGLGTPMAADTLVGEVGDLAWADATSIDVLGSLPEAGQQALQVTVGSGQVQPLGVPPEPVSIAAAPASLSLVATGEAQVLSNVGLQWREFTGGRAAAYPG